TGLLFGGGRFGPWAVATSGQALVGFAAGMPALAWVKLASGRFYAVHETRSPVKASVLGLVVFAALGFLLTPRWGAPGVAAATSLSQYAAGCYLGWRLRTSGRAPKRELFSSLWRHGLSAGLMAAALKVLADRTAFPLVTSLRSAAMVAGFGLLGLAVYTVGLWLTRAPELAEIKRLLQRR
ncbi:MAG: lipid II flippase MurJ, partial [Thermoanaerobaculum sp.]